MRGWVRGAGGLGWLVMAALACGEPESAPYADTGRGAPRGATASGSASAADDNEMPDDEMPDDDAPPAGASAPAPADAGTDTTPGSTPGGAALDLVRLLDERGDAQSWPGMLRLPLDVVSVELESVGDELRVRFEFSRTLAEHFAFPGVDGQRTAGAPAELHLDLDDDPSTGAEVIWADESPWGDELIGYEVELAVLLGFDFVTRADGSEGYGGGDVILDDDEVEITGHYADYWLIDRTEDMRLGPAATDGGFGSTLPDTRPLTTIDGEVVELRVPLAWLDLEPGDVVKVMFRESDQGPASGLGYSRNARLRVR